MNFTCVPGSDLLTGNDEGCCYGWVVREACTCWEPVYDLDQAEPCPTEDREYRSTRCGDCAYRPDSPEMADEHQADHLRSLRAEQVFWCHQGIRRPVLWRHPDGREVPGDPADYRPPEINKVPYRADGRPAAVCAGWSEMQLERAHEATA